MMTRCSFAESMASMLWVQEVILSMPEYNLEPTVTAYTTYMDACLRVRPSTTAQRS